VERRSREMQRGIILSRSMAHARVLSNVFKLFLQGAMLKKRRKKGSKVARLSAERPPMSGDLMWPLLARPLSFGLHIPTSKRSNFVS
jgi:hypothetical protein